MNKTQINSFPGFNLISLRYCTDAVTGTRPVISIVEFGKRAVHGGCIRVWLEEERWGVRGRRATGGRREDGTAGFVICRNVF